MGLKTRVAENVLLSKPACCVLVLAISAGLFVLLLVATGFPFLGLEIPNGSLLASDALPPVALALIAWAISGALGCVVAWFRNELDRFDFLFAGSFSGATAYGLYAASFLLKFYVVKTGVLILLCLPTFIFVLRTLYKRMTKGTALSIAFVDSLGTLQLLAAMASIMLMWILMFSLKGVIYTETSGSGADAAPEDAAMRIVYSKEYVGASQDERLDMLADFVDAETKHLGIEAPALRAVLADSRTDAFYNDDDRIIYINSNSSPLNSTSGNIVPMIILHEVYHVYQYDIVKNRIDTPDSLPQERIDAWKQNMEGYISPDSGSLTGYEGQALEEDADEYAESRIRELVDMEEVLAAMAE